MATDSLGTDGRDGIVRYRIEDKDDDEDEIGADIDELREIGERLSETRDWAYNKGGSR